MYSSLSSLCKPPVAVLLLNSLLNLIQKGKDRIDFKLVNCVKLGGAVLSPRYILEYYFYNVANRISKTFWLKTMNSI